MERPHDKDVASQEGKNICLHGKVAIVDIYITMCHVKGVSRFIKVVKFMKLRK